MMRRDRTRTVFVWLLGIAFLALVWVISAQISALLTNDAPKSGDTAPPDLPASASSPPLFAMPDRVSLAVILERPVFSETRRPSGDPDGGRARPTDFTLAGVMISASERSALIQSGNGQPIQRLKEGDEIGGWMLVEIALDRIKIRRGGVEAEMLMDYAAPAPPIPRDRISQAKADREPGGAKASKTDPQ